MSNVDIVFIGDRLYTDIAISVCYIIYFVPVHSGGRAVNNGGHHCTIDT